MGTRERREREKENLRQEILDAARQLFVKNGYDNVSMRQIAEKIEYSPTTIYLYFKDKDELIQSLVEETFRKLEHELEAIKTAGLDPVLSLRKGAEAYIRFGLHYPHHYQLVFMTPHPPRPDGECRIKGTPGDRAFGYLLEVITYGIEQRLFRQSDPMVTAVSAWATLHGITSLLIIKGDFLEVNREVLIANSVELLVKGVAA